MLCADAIVQIAAGAVPNARQNGALSNRVAVQAVGDEALGLMLKSAQQAPEEALGGGAISALLMWRRRRSAHLGHSADKG
jgi:hypothetical protein